MEIVFRSPRYLWFLLSVAVLIFLHFVSLKHIKRRALKFANFEAIERVTGSEILSKNILLLYIRIAIIICVVFAMAGTRVWYTGKASVSDYVLAIDASSSMLAQDMLPSRLEAAKSAAVAFVDSLVSRTEVGVVSFAGSSFIEQDLTSDLNKVKDAIKGIQIKVVGGTDILDAVVTGTDILFKGKNLKTIILITDGQINVGTVDDVIDYAKKNSVVIHTVGIGTVLGGALPLEGGGGIYSKLDEESLRSIAYNTGGIYSLTTTKEELAKTYTGLVTLTKTRLSLDISVHLIFFALLLLLAEWLLINTRYRTLP